MSTQPITGVLTSWHLAADRNRNMEPTLQKAQLEFISFPLFTTAFCQLTFYFFHYIAACPIMGILISLTTVRMRRLHLVQLCLARRHHEYRVRIHIRFGVTDNFCHLTFYFLNYITTHFITGILLSLAAARIRRHHLVHLLLKCKNHDPP
jgi:hypothetical protein